MRTPLNVSAAALGDVSPEKDKAGVVAGLGDFQNAVDIRDSELRDLQAQAVDELGVAAFNTLQRRFGLLGYGLFPLTDDTLLVTHARLGLHRTLYGMGSARAFLQLAGGCDV